MRATIVFLAAAAAVMGAVSALGFNGVTTGSPAQEGAAALFGDVDCDASVNSVDGLKILRYSASLAVTQNEPCPDIGSTPTPAPTSPFSPTPTTSPAPVQPGARLISLGTIYASGGEIKFPLVDIGDCARISVLASSDGNGALSFPGQPQFLGYTSPDGGTTLISVQPTSWGTILQGGTPGAVTLAMDGAVVALPNLRVALEAIDSNVTAWIWCQP